jgi:membrane-associated phospholipid phosphatase
VSFIRISRWHALLWLLAGAVALTLAWLFDDRVDAVLLVVHRQHPHWHRLAWWCSKIGEGWVIAVWGMVCAALYLLVNRPLAAAKIICVVLTAETTGLMATILRLLFGRTRPLAETPQGFYGMWHDGHWIIGAYQFSSFPSGHSASAAGLAAAAWLLHRGWGAVAAMYALAVMWSRLALQCHHLSDVVASAAFSIPLAIMLKPLLLPALEFHFGNLNRRLRKE